MSRLNAKKTLPSSDKLSAYEQTAARYQGRDREF